MAGPSLLAVVLAVVVYVYPLLLAPRIALFDPDEGLHAAIAQEMVERGDWVVPRLQGKPFSDKPILYFWAEAASLWTFGMSQWAVRLPGMIFGLLAMLATGIAGGRMFGRAAGMLAAMFYATMILPAAMTQIPSHDVALVPWVTLAILLFWEMDRATHSTGLSTGYILAIAALLALSILTKGLVGVVLVGIAYGGYLLLTWRLTVAACLRGAVALLLAALAASVWYLAMEHRNPGYLHYYFIERHVQGFATGTQRHGGLPWWYYVPLLLGGGLPWIAYLPVLLRDQWEKRGERRGSSAPDKPFILLACWLVGGTLFLSLSHSKAHDVRLAHVSSGSNFRRGRLDAAAGRYAQPSRQASAGGDTLVFGRCRSRGAASSVGDRPATARRALSGERVGGRNGRCGGKLRPIGLLARRTLSGRASLGPAVDGRPIRPRHDAGHADCQPGILGYRFGTLFQPAEEFSAAAASCRREHRLANVLLGPATPPKPRPQSG